MSKAYFAYVAGLRKDWQQLVTPPKAPANYKDILKIEEFEQKAWSLLGATAKNDVMTGQIEVVKHSTSMNPAGVLLKPGQALAFAPQFVRCFCLKPLTFLRLAVAESIGLSGALPQNLQWAIKSSSSGRALLTEESSPAGADPLMHGAGANVIGGASTYPAFIDPVSAILGSSAYDEDDLPRIAKRFGVPVPVDVDSQLAFVRGLAKLIGEA